MEASSSVVVNSYLTKRKAEFDPEVEEEVEEEEIEESKSKIVEPEDFDMLQAPDWDVDSFDALEYYSSTGSDSSSDDEEARAHTRIYKRQIIDSKGFYLDPELRPGNRFKRIRPMSLDVYAGQDLTYRKYLEETVSICLQKYNQDKAKDSKVELVEVVRGNCSAPPRKKSYITFMAREKQDGPLVEYQAKSLLTFDGKRHPILCRPTPTPKTTL